MESTQSALCGYISFVLPLYYLHIFCSSLMIKLKLVSTPFRFIILPNTSVIYILILLMIVLFTSQYEIIVGSFENG